jgi:hypothetical protein
MNQKWQYSIDSRKEYLVTRNKEVARLRNSVAHPRSKRIDEYINTVITAYEKSTEVGKITKYREEKEIENRGFRRIGLQQSILIDKDKLLAEDYSWLSFFSDVGRAISHGERRYIHYRLGKYVRGTHNKISIFKPDFDILNKQIIYLRGKGFKPNVMLAPLQIYSLFVKNYKAILAETNYNTDKIQIEGCEMQIAWSNIYAPLRSFIILDSSYGIWHVITDMESKSGITAAIGESKTNVNKMSCLVETMAYYEILNKDAFARINLSNNNS